MESLAPFSKTKGTLGVQLLAMFGLGFTEICYFVDVSCLASFFPKEAELNGVSISVSGIVFVVSPLVVVIASPFLGKLVSKIGARKSLFLGMIIVGFSNILFGFLDRIQSSSIFIICCILVRIISGIGAVGIGTNVIFLAAAFPNDINKAMGMNEIFSGIGVGIGPTLGGLLYDLGGFPLPFWVIGSVVFVLIPISNYCLPEVNEETAPELCSGQMWELARSPVVYLNLLATFVFVCGWTFIEPILEPKFRKEYGASSTMIGTIFFVMAVSYTISSVLSGRIADHVKCTWILTFIGCCGCGLAILSLHSALFFNFTNKLWFKVCSLGLLGFFVGLGLVPTYGAMLEDSISRGFADDSVLYATLSGFWNSVYSFGEVIGPIFGAVVTDHFGFYMTTDSMAIAFFVMGGIFWIYFIISSISNFKRLGYASLLKHQDTSDLRYGSDRRR